MKIKTVIHWKNILISHLILAIVILPVVILVELLGLNDLEGMIVGVFTGSITILACMCKWDFVSSELIE